MAVIDTFAQEYDTTLDRILNDTSRSCVDRLRSYFDSGPHLVDAADWPVGY